MLDGREPLVHGCINGDPHKPKPARGRLVDRQARFGQSTGRFKVERLVRSRVRRTLYLNDWFHTLVNTRSYRIVGVVVSVYLLLFVVFALLYVAAANKPGCFPELSTPIPNGTVPAKGHTPAADFSVRFLRALFFSLETMMTIGYGVDDQYFGDCPMMLVLICLQSLTGIFASSILFGIVLTRVSRADQRACTVAFSEKSIVRAAYNELYLVLRVTEMRKHQLTQAYVHAYAMCDSADVIGDTAAAEEGSSVHALPMELVHPVRTEGGREGSRRRPPALAQRLSHATASPRRLSPLLRVLSRRRAR